MRNRGLLRITVLLLSSVVTGSNAQTETVISDIYEEIENVKKLLGDLSRQVMMQQFFVEERVRSEGYSGIKIVRGGGKGLKNYNSATHVNVKVFAIHDHSDYDRTMGMGEVAVVMNGVEFRTRHNDYKLSMPSRTSGAYNALEDIPFPEVPPEVLNKPTIREQVLEMREWYKAFQQQDKSIRDYTKYFKPIMCYIEGAWISTDNFSDPFPSDRHKLDAYSWDDLHRKSRFIANTGARSRLENVAYLPTTIMSVDKNTGIPTYAQWTYRIICSPIKYDIPFSYFKQQDDLSYRVTTNANLYQVSLRRAARYKLFDGDRNQHYGLLDRIFADIPGKNNFGGNLSLTLGGENLFDDSSFGSKRTRLNTAYYHRAFKTYRPEDPSMAYSAFGFNDENLFIAQTTQSMVMPIEAEQCFYVLSTSGSQKYNLQCVNSDVRLTYALPLEIIYLTPLLSWNPYNFTYNTDHRVTVEGGRYGGSVATAFNGVDRYRYYQTPFEFFTGKLDTSDPADTVKGYTWVANSEGNAYKTSASGVRILMQDISGIGTIRLRYPIAPIYGEGSSVWKELNALKDSVQRKTDDPPTIVLFQTSLTVKIPPGEHFHDIMITYQEYTSLLAGNMLNVTTLEAQGHTHDMVLSYSESEKFKYEKCDGVALCWDGHNQIITQETATSTSASDSNS